MMPQLHRQMNKAIRRPHLAAERQWPTRLLRRAVWSSACLASIRLAMRGHSTHPGDVPKNITPVVVAKETQPEEELPYVLIPPNEFSWRSQTPIELSPQQWKLLSYCLENPRTEVQDIADHLWGDESSSDTSESSLDSLKSKLNSRLAEAAIPISLSRKTGYLICSVDG